MTDGGGPSEPRDERDSTSEFSEADIRLATILLVALLLAAAAYIASSPS